MSPLETLRRIQGIIPTKKRTPRSRKLVGTKRNPRSLNLVLETIDYHITRSQRSRNFLVETIRADRRKTLALFLQLLEDRETKQVHKGEEGPKKKRKALKGKKRKALKGRIVGKDVEAQEWSNDCFLLVNLPSN